MQNNALIELLTSLREARQDLASRSINEEPQLFSSFFDFENNDNLLCLSFDREYSIFLNNNLEKMSYHISNPEDFDTQEKIKLIAEAFISFNKKKNKISSTNVDTFFLSDKVANIDKLFSVFLKDKDRLDQINYMRRKDQVLFEREFNRLLGESNGLGE